MPDYTLFTDGGGEKQSTAASACILEDAAGNRRKILAVLGPATNNEAEICGGLIGFAALRALTNEDRIAVRWVCDSEYTLKSATGYIFAWQRNGWKTADRKPVKNQGLWQCFLRLTRGMDLTPQHVRGHAGHTENEACDRAASWARTNGVDGVAAGDDGFSVTVDASAHGRDWQLFDLRSILALLRDEETSAACELLCEKLKKAPFAPVREEAAAAEAPAAGSLEVERIVTQLRAICSDLQGLAGIDPRAARLAGSLKRLLQNDAKR